MKLDRRDCHDEESEENDQEENDCREEIDDDDVILELVEPGNEINSRAHDRAKFGQVDLILSLAEIEW